MDTIAAIATPPGRGAIAIVRCSGPDARTIVTRVFRSRRPPRDRIATFGTLLDVAGEPLDDALALFFAAPRSVTGEDVVELHVHGAPVVAREALRSVLHAGARPAGPGEFTRRAFLNGKLDLSAAESVADVIAAESRAQARAAHAHLSGALHRAIAGARAGLDGILAQLAGAVDYPEEVLEPPREALAATIAGVDAELATLIASWERGRAIREGLAVAIVGPPNAGKSSLLNALLGEERAIVSPAPGTTRDTIEERVFVDGVPVRIVDTAGIRASADALERAGVARARAALDAATIALVVVDGSRALDDAARTILSATRARPRLVFFNKRDVGSDGYAQREPAEADALHGSVRDAETLARLRAELARIGWGDDAPLDLTRPHLASARQAEAVARARSALGEARATLDLGAPADLLVGDLVAASAALGEITGSAATEALLDDLFARFCIGK